MYTEAGEGTLIELRKKGRKFGSILRAFLESLLFECRKMKLTVVNIQCTNKHLWCFKLNICRKL